MQCIIRFPYYFWVYIRLPLFICIQINQQVVLHLHGYTRYGWNKCRKLNNFAEVILKCHGIFLYSWLFPIYGLLKKKKSNVTLISTPNPKCRTKLFYCIVRWSHERNQRSHRRYAGRAAGGVAATKFFCTGIPSLQKIKIPSILICLLWIQSSSCQVVQGTRRVHHSYICTSTTDAPLKFRINHVYMCIVPHYNF